MPLWGEMEVLFNLRRLGKTLLIRWHLRKVLKEVREEDKTIPIANRKNRKGKNHEAGARLVSLKTHRR